MFETRTIVLDDATIVYDVRGPEPASDHTPLLLIGQPMDASGFTALADEFSDRTVVTYDPRGLGRSTRRDGGVDADPDVQGADVHRIIGELDAGPVDVFASSGGAVAAFALVAAHPTAVATLVAHEPPVASVLPDEDAVYRAFADVVADYQARGWSAGMVRFLAMNMWQGEFTADYFARPAPSPVDFGFADADDGGRDDPLFCGSAAVIAFRPDVAALLRAQTRVVIAVGEESAGTFTARTSERMAALLQQRAVVFPSHHGGFVGGDGPHAGRPAAFAERLRSILDPSP